MQGSKWLLMTFIVLSRYHITVQYTTLHYIIFALHYIITLHYITLHYIALRCIALHCIALHCIALQQSTLHYITCTVSYPILSYPTISCHIISYHICQYHTYKFKKCRKQMNKHYMNLRVFPSEKKYWCRSMANGHFHHLLGVLSAKHHTFVAKDLTRVQVAARDVFLRAVIE